MPNYKANEEIIMQMTTADKAALLSIYQHRCLSAPLLGGHTYDSLSSAIERLSFMVREGLLKEVNYGAEYPALFLTTLGIKTVEYIYGDYLKTIYKPDKNGGRLPMAKDLLMNIKIINHQMHLNRFSLDFESYVNGQTDYIYYDEKFMPIVSESLMPDGMIELPDRFFLLEMDMGTEASDRLSQKWNGYRTFLNHPKPKYMEKPMIMLFILDGIKNHEKRKKNVIATMMKYVGDKIGADFDVYVESPCVCHGIIQDKYLLGETPIERKVAAVCANISKRHSFKLSKPPFLTRLDHLHDFYARKLTADKKVETINGRPQEFLIDFWLDGRLSLLCNIMRYKQSLMTMKSAVGRILSYVVVIPSEKWASYLLHYLHGVQPQTLFFTTPNRLENRLWEESVFRIDQLGNIVHFKDRSLKETIHECRANQI